MKKFSKSVAVANLVFVTSFFTASLNPAESQTFEHKMTGFAGQEAPHTASQIVDYLAKMRRLINRYDNCLAGMMSNMAGGMGLDPTNVPAASAQTQQLAQDIKAVLPPKDIASSHNKLADAMGYVESFLAAGSKSPSSFPQALALAGQTQSAFKGYHADVLKLIDQYGLNRSLDPYADESASDKAKASKSVADLKSQFSGESMVFGPHGLTSPSGSLSSGALGAGAGDGMAAIGKMLGNMGGGAGGSGAGGLGDLSKILGGAAGGSGAGGLGDLGKLLGGGNGAGGAGDLGSLLGGGNSAGSSAMSGLDDQGPGSSGQSDIGGGSNSGAPGAGGGLGGGLGGALGDHGLGGALGNSGLGGALGSHGLGGALGNSGLGGALGSHGLGGALGDHGGLGSSGDSAQSSSAGGGFGAASSSLGGGSNTPNLDLGGLVKQLGAHQEALNQAVNAP